MRLTDGLTDGRTEFSSRDRVCIACSAVYGWAIEKAGRSARSGKLRVRSLGPL